MHGVFIVCVVRKGIGFFWLDSDWGKNDKCVERRFGRRVAFLFFCFFCFFCVFCFFPFSFQGLIQDKSILQSDGSYLYP